MPHHCVTPRLCLIARGEPIFKFSDHTRTYPVQAGTWNHRAAAFYAAVEAAPKSLNVEPVLRR